MLVAKMSQDLVYDVLVLDTPVRRIDTQSLTQVRQRAITGVLGVLSQLLEIF